MKSIDVRSLAGAGGDLAVGCSPPSRRSTTTARSGRSSRTTASSATARTRPSGKGGFRLDVRESALAAAESGEQADRARQAGQERADPADQRGRCRRADAAAGREQAADRRRQAAAGAVDRRGGEVSDALVVRRAAAAAAAGGEERDLAAQRTGHVSSWPAWSAKGSRRRPRPTSPRSIRRLTLDLTGLPPTLAEVDAFLADERPDAYERLVDRLLASPRYGERMAVDWLDAARFADTHGYHIDSGRDMTRWRE